MCPTVPGWTTVILALEESFLIFSFPVPGQITLSVEIIFDTPCFFVFTVEMRCPRWGHGDSGDRGYRLDPRFACSGRLNLAAQDLSAKLPQSGAYPPQSDPHGQVLVLFVGDELDELAFACNWAPMAAP